jgi:predicted NUDIX family phosphoesterase
MNTVNRGELKEKYEAERVFVVKNVVLPKLNEGFNTVKQVEDTGLSLALLDKLGSFEYRYMVEYNPKYRQIIPYCVVCHDNKYFAMRRLAGSGEARLHQKITIGIGGHINPIDDGYNVFGTALKRELNEEVNIENVLISDITWVGILNDNSNQVSQDHLGLVYIVKVSSSDIAVIETDKLEGHFLSRNDLLLSYSCLESWSQIVFDSLIK